MSPVPPGEAEGQGRRSTIPPQPSTETGVCGMMAWA